MKPTPILNMISKHLLSVLLLVHSTALLADDRAVNIIYIGDTDSTAYLGAQQGLEEANLQGQFLGQSYQLIESTVAEIDEDMDDSVIAIISATESRELRALGKLYKDMAVMNVSRDEDDLRLQCAANLLHVIPSQQMKTDARAQWLTKHPDSSAIGQAWHADFVKFAARDLNKRYKKTHGVEMDDLGWAGWAAVKMISDTVARGNVSEPSAMLDYLKNELVFDGQKGINMTFRSTGQLRQPILIIENDAIVAEAPVRGVANPSTLDSLGITSCPE